MSNYVLSISLEGADKADAALDSLLSKVGKLSSGSVDFSMDKAIDASGMLGAGEDAGEKFSKGIKKGVKKNLIGNWLGLSGEMGVAIQKGAKDFGKIWDDAVKNGIRGNTTNGGALAQFINQRHASSGKEVDKDFWTSMFPALITRPPETTPKSYGSKLAGVQSMGDITQFDKKFNKSAFYRDLAVGGIATLFNPFVGAGMLSGSIGKHQGKGNGTLGALSTMSYGEVFVAVKVLSLAFKALTAVVTQSMKAIANAGSIYSAALQNGMGLNFTVKRTTLAKIMGVSEQDVFRFGAQMNYLNPKLEQAASILAKTATPLTQVSWEFKVLKVDMESMFALIADQATPVVLGFTNALDGLIKWLTSHTSYLNALVNGSASGASSAILGNASGPMGAIMKMFGLYGSIQSAKGAMPSPQAWMKQLPASSLEKMGLVTMGGSQNYQKDISKNTKEIAAGIKILIGQNSGKRQNSSFNMSPNTSQP